MNISIQISGNTELINRLKKLETGLGSFDTAFGELGKRIVSFTENEVFGSKGGALSGMLNSSQGGVPWAKLSENTLEARKRGWGSYKNNAASANASQILRWTGKMQGSFYYKSSPRGLEIGNRASYFKYHQSSDPARSRLPRRPMLGVNNTVKNMIMDVIVADVRRKAGVI